MHIQCSKKMLDFLKPVLTEKDTDDDLFAWHANYETILRKKFFILMNDVTRFCVFLYGLKKSDFQDPIFPFQKAILIAMSMEGYDKELILKYVNGIKEVTYGPTKNRTLVSQMNRAMIDADWFAHDELVDDVHQPELCHRLNDGIVGTDHGKKWHVPQEKMLECLKLLFAE